MFMKCRYRAVEIKVLFQVRNIDELAHHALNCLVQLASLSGGIVNNDESRLKYLNNYLVNFFQLISKFVSLVTFIIHSSK